MHRILFFAGTPYAISSFGFMVGLGVLVGAWINHLRRERSGLSSYGLQDALVWALVVGVFGARLIYVLQNIPRYSASPLEILDFREGGITWYGALFGGILGIWLYCRKQGAKLAPVLDTFAPSLLVAHAIGRVGCLLNGCCYGKASTLPWAVWLSDAGHPVNAVSRHPVQIYESLMDLIALALLLWLERRIPSRDGRVFALFVGFYGVIRFIAEFFREGDPLALGLTLAQWSSIAIAAVAFAFARRPAPATE
ncbi:MAG: prolipoprotein diacylglyceryl transferase [Candidatus Xenobia bacterium]